MRLLLLAPLLAIAACGQDSAPVEPPANEASEDTGQSEPEGAAVSSYGNGIVNLESRDDVVTTVERLEQALKDGGFIIVGLADHEMNASQAGLELGPAVSIIFGKPEVGTYLMQEAPEAALDLPQRMAVYRKDGKTIIAYNDPVWLASRHGIIDQKDRLDAISRALEDFAQKAAGNEPQSDQRDDGPQQGSPR